MYFPDREMLDEFIKTSTTAQPSQYGKGWARQTGYMKQQGGYMQKALDFLFEEDEIPVSEQAPSNIDTSDIEEREAELGNRERKLMRDANYNLALQQAIAGGIDNPYRTNPDLLGGDTSGYPIVGNINPYKAANTDFYGASQSLEGQKYLFGGDGTGGGGVDCSGAVCKIVGLPRTTSEGILTHSNNFRMFSGDPSELTHGTVVGFDTGPTSFDGGRRYGIDHVGVVVKNPKTGKLEYKHSAGSTGFKTLSVEDMLKKYKNSGAIYLGNYKVGGVLK
jgi:cell wall-associated NlpC family hydrolase